VIQPFIGENVMRPSTSVKLLAVAAVSVFVPLFFPSGAQPGREDGGASHGGVVAKTKTHYFEAVFSPGGVTLYVLGADRKPAAVSQLSANATFYHPSSRNPWFTRKLKATTAANGQPNARLDLRMDLKTVPANGAEVSFDVTGLSDPRERAASFTVPFTLAADRKLAVGTATKADEKAIAAQKVCPVSGEELGGEMGAPVKVTGGGKSIFLCCKNCLKQVQANQDKYFGSPGEHKKEGPEGRQQSR
jgi:hypothetical protein